MHNLLLFIEQAPVAIAIFDDQMRYIAVSDRWVRDYDIEPPVIGRSHYEVFPDFPTKWKAIHRRALDGESVRADEDRFDRPDGSVQWLRWEISPWRRGPGEIGGVMVVSEDITERKRTDEALRESEARFRAMFESAAVGIAQVSPTGTWLRMNDRLCGMLGYTPSELKTKTFQDITHPDDLDTDLASAQLLLAGETNSYSLQKRYLRKDGEIVWADLTVSCARKEDRTVDYFVSVIVDITARQQAEGALRASEERLRAIFDTAVDALVVIDKAGLIQSANPAVRSMFGYAREELIGKNVKVLMPEGYALVHDGNLQAYARTGVKGIIGKGREVEGRRADGSTFPVDLSVAEWRDAEERPFFTVTMRDITARKAATEALASASRYEAIGQLAGGIAHDFNNLLAVIGGNLELLEQRIEDETERDLVRRARDATEAGASFNRRLLSLARIRKLSPTKLSLNARIEETTKLLRRTLGEHIEFAVTLEKNDWPVLADPGEIDSVLLNLALNARDAMAAGGTLQINTANVTIDPSSEGIPASATPGDYVRLSVADTGTGMTKEVLRRALDPFFTTKEPGKGTGLGLSSVHIFARESGGLVTLESGLGKGTTVSLYLPRAPAEKIATQKDSHGEKLPFGDGQLILVVEDNDLVREVTLRRLETLGYSVAESRSGPEAIQVLEADGSVRLVLSDIMMSGGMTGHELARWVRTAKPDVALVLCSGHDQSGLSDSLLQGAALLRKPYTRAELAHAIHNALEAQSDQSALTSAVNT